MSELTDEQENRLAELEENISNLRSEFDFWKQSGIPEKTLIILLSHSTKVPQKTIKLVIEGLDSLHDEYFLGDIDE